MLLLNISFGILPNSDIIEVFDKITKDNEEE